MLPILRIIYDSELVYLGSPTPQELRNAISYYGELDCFFVNFDRNFHDREWQLVTELVSAPTDWIQVFGYNAESLHDSCDQASVHIGRQKAVGDGSPMTSWDFSVDPREIAEHILTGGHGAASVTLLLIIGTQDQQQALIEALQQERDS